MTFEELFKLDSVNSVAGNSSPITITKDNLSDLWNIIKNHKEGVPYIIRSIEKGSLYIIYDICNRKALLCVVHEYIDSFHCRDVNYAERVKNFENKEIF